MSRQAVLAAISVLLVTLTLPPVSIVANNVALPDALVRHAALSAVPHAISTLTVHTLPDSPRPGDVVVLRAHVDTNAVQVVGQWDGRLIHFAPESEAISVTAAVSATEASFIALVGLDALQPPGAYSLTITALAADGTMTQTITPLRIEPKRILLERVRLSQALSMTLDPAVNSHEAVVFSQVYSRFSAQKRWNGPLQLPVKGRVLALYGNRRVYNGVDLGTYHNGYDVLVRKGTPVKAAAPGQVVVVRPFAIHGLSVTVDHGRGVFTTYSHLSDTLAIEGQMVDTGDVIGVVGSTGRSQGPHLHFELAVGGVTVDPGPWLRAALP